MITAKFVSKRGDTGQGKRRKPSQPHSKTKQPKAKRDFPITGNPFFHACTADI